MAFAGMTCGVDARTHRCFMTLPNFFGRLATTALRGWFLGAVERQGRFFARLSPAAYSLCAPLPH